LPGDLYFARGFGGQLVAVVPSHDAVIVMLNSFYGEESAPIVDLVADVLAVVGGPVK
jgi:hypothetical protein